ncbi:hypothetical protein PR202_ga09407 [Eleusine coracana subsp. coracana]|uniref:Uncharacterized protein n=1 Tax=Eleusine coracana subsp. coracana TaxID=191504 RepID=A0AAV5C332_ELECO|nr:hypothetical protein PR202_ga09407 [Eleusine coracana subsp. coracana]
MNDSARRGQQLPFHGHRRGAWTWTMELSALRRSATAWRISVPAAFSTRSSCRTVITVASTPSPTIAPASSPPPRRSAYTPRPSLHVDHVPALAARGRRVHRLLHRPVPAAPAFGLGERAFPGSCGALGVEHGEQRGVARDLSGSRRATTACRSSGPSSTRPSVHVTLIGDRRAAPSHVRASSWGASAEDSARRSGARSMSWTQSASAARRLRSSLELPSNPATTAAAATCCPRLGCRARGDDNSPSARLTSHEVRSGELARRSGAARLRRRKAAAQQTRTAKENTMTNGSGLHGETFLWEVEGNRGGSLLRLVVATG